MRSVRLILAVLLVAALNHQGVSFAQDTPVAAPQYKLTIIEDASTSKRVKKNRVTSQVVVQVTDTNNVPVPGIAVVFTIPQLTGSGAAFANGSQMTVATTNPSGQASGSFTAMPGSMFSVAASVSVSGAPVTAVIPVTIAATAAAAAAGISTSLLVTILALAGAGAAAGAAVAITNRSSGPTGTVGTVGTVSFGKP